MKKITNIITIALFFAVILFVFLLNIILPDGEISKEDAKEILEYAIEGRRRVKEQLKRMAPTEFFDTDLGYTDIETGEKITVSVPEKY